LGGSATTSATPNAAFAKAHVAYANPIHAKHSLSVFASATAVATAAASNSARPTLSAVAACTRPYPPRQPLAAFAAHCAGAAALRTKKYGLACLAISGVARNSEKRGSRSARSVAAATPPHTAAARNAILTSPAASRYRPAPTLLPTFAVTPSTRKLNTTLPNEVAVTTKPKDACRAVALRPSMASCAMTAKGTIAFITAALADSRSRDPVDTILESTGGDAREEE